MAHAQHAEAVRQALLDVERKHRKTDRAIRVLHSALAAYAAEHGAECGIEPELVAMAVLPKDPPDNGGGG